MYGVTHSESFHLLNSATLQFGRKQNQLTINRLLKELN